MLKQEKGNHRQQESIQEVYKGGPQGNTREQKEIEQRTTHQALFVPTKPHLQPIQVKESSKELVLSSMYRFDHDQRLPKTPLLQPSRALPKKNHLFFFFFLALGSDTM